MDLNPDTDDLPLRANTNHILVRHYVLDLTVQFDRKVISGSAVLFLEPCLAVGTKVENDIGPGAGKIDGNVEAGESQDGFVSRNWDVDTQEVGIKELENITTKTDGFGARERNESSVGLQTAAEAKNIQSPHLWETTSDRDFTLVLDCCDLDVSKVEEVDVTLVSAMSSVLPDVAYETSGLSLVEKQTAFIQKLVSMPSNQWKQKHQLFSQCSCAPVTRDGTSLHFHRDQWSLQVRKKGVTSSQDFPRAVRICYETRPTGGSVRWTRDQDNRFVSGCKNVWVRSLYCSDSCNVNHSVIL